MDYNDVMDGSGNWLSSTYADCKKIKTTSSGNPFDTGTLCSQVHDGDAHVFLAGCACDHSKLGIESNAPVISNSCPSF